MSPRAIWTIFRKDVIDAVRNRYLLITVLSPVAMALLFRLMFGATAGDPRPIAIVAYDPGHSRLVAALQALPGVQLVRATAAATLPAEVEAQQAAGGLAVPIGFDTAMAAGEQPELTVYLNQQRSQAEQEAWGLLLQQQLRALANQPPPARLTWLHVAAPLPPQEGLQSQLERVLLVVLLMMALTMTGGLVVPLLLVEEKEKHTLPFLLLTPAGAADVVAGKALTGLLYGGATVTVLLLLNHSAVANWPLTCLTALLGALLIVAVGLLLGVVFHNTMQVNTWASLVVLLMLVPSFVLPLGLSPGLTTVMHALPTFYLMRALDLSLAGSARPGQMAVNLGALVASVAIAFAAVAWALRRQER